MSREISTLRTVTNVTPDMPDDSLAKISATMADVGQKVISQSQQAKLTENLSAAQLELNDLSNQYQLKYEGDPFNKKGAEDYQKQRQMIFDKYGQSVSPVFRGDWNANAQKIIKQNELITQDWGYKQSRINTKQSIEKSIGNYLVQASIDGENFGSSDATEIESFSNYQNAAEQLRSFGEANLGATSTAKLTEDFEQNWAKTFLSGVAKTDPAKALRMLDSDVVKNSITNQEDFSKFRDAIEAKALNVQEEAKKREILQVMKDENSLLSSNETLSYSQIVAATKSMSEPARDYFLKKNGFKQPDGGAAGGELKKKEAPLQNDQKLEVKAGIYDTINKLARSDQLTTENVSTLQNQIYDAMRRKAITQEEGANFISQMIAPVLDKKESELSDFSAGDWNPFNADVGFEQVQQFFEDKVEIQPIGEEDKVGAVSSAINATNKVKLYDSYYSALEVEAKAIRTPQKPNGLSITDVANLPKIQRNEIYAKAQARAINDFSASSSPVLKVEPGIPLDAIKKLRENPTLAPQFDEIFGVGRANRVLNGGSL